MALRRLLVIADDFGIGPKTSEGIIHCANSGHSISGTVLLVNSQFAEHAMALLKSSKCNLLVGWHPNLTLDKPVLHPSKVSTLVDREGTFFPLKVFIQSGCLALLMATRFMTSWKLNYFALNSSQAPFLC